MTPYRTLYTGARMPAIGLGTFGSDHVTADQVAEAVVGAVEVGYRHIDCASVYGNEDRIGESLRAVMLRGVPREELWIVSKLWNDKHAERDVIPPARNRCAICGWTTSTCTWSTGRSPISIRRIAMSPRAVPTRGPTSTRIS